MSGFDSQIPGGDDPRAESPGEAQYRLAALFISFWRIFGVKFTEHHREAAALLFGPFLHRWPWLGKIKAPKEA